MAAAKSINVKVTGISLAQVPSMPVPEGQTPVEKQFFHVSMTPVDQLGQPGQPSPGVTPLTFIFEDTSGIDVGAVYELALTKAKAE